MNNREIRRVLATLPEPFFGANLYDEQEITAAVRVIHNQSPFRYYGTKCTFEARHFEEESAQFYGTKYAATTNSGTGALVLALHAMEIGPGDEVIVPGFFWISVSNAVLLCGAIPVLCEIDSTLNMDPEDLRQKITGKTKCVVVVHMYGGQADVRSIREICNDRRVRILEDFSQCSGASVAGRMLGSFGDMAVSSLQLNKAITSGEGGLILSDDEGLISRAMARSDTGYGRAGGISSTETAGAETTIGEGRRFNEISAAIMRVQLRRLPKMVGAMTASKRYILEHLPERPGIELRTVVDPAGDHGSTIALIFASAGEAGRFTDTGKRLFGEDLWFMTHLKEFGQHIYYNCSNLVEKLPVLRGGLPWTLPENRGNYHYEMGTCPQTDSLLARSVGMIVVPNLNEIQREAVVEAVGAVIGAG